MPGPERPAASLGFDPTRPNGARVYDYFLGGKDNFAADREAAEQVRRLLPEMPMVARENRRFLGRVTRFLVDAGIRQFIDIGTGLPTQGHVHEILQSLAPDARVVYVDHDPVVIVHAQAMLEGNGRTAVVPADLRSPDDILAAPQLRRLIDLEQPVGIMLLAVLPFVPDDDEVRHTITQLHKAVAPGSYVAISHTLPHARREVREELAAAYRVPLMGVPEQRTASQITALLDDWDIVEPGVVRLPAWRPELGGIVQDPGPIWLIGGVARKN
ncbi:SAM-dependent methyltransferase [Actinomadura scrupuli]|uniref:SAM-dependent methyltransferase n=1 Tax=Actinomadura scrupuli TaxID=559629 RepID=UPI003D971E54